MKTKQQIAKRIEFHEIGIQRVNDEYQRLCDSLGEGTIGAERFRDEASTIFRVRRGHEESIKTLKWVME